MKPKLLIDLDKVKQNATELVRVAHEQNVTVTGITKGDCGNLDFAHTLVESGVDYLADSRVENLKKLSSLMIEKMLLRSPKLSEVQDVVRYADYSLNTELKVIEALSNAARSQNKTHQIILMIDVGDLREGIWFEDDTAILTAVNKTLQLPNVHLAGIGTNLTCFGGIIPTRKNYGIIHQIAHHIRQTFNIELPIISGGNSSSLHMLYETGIAGGINNIRVNQAIFTGQEIAFGQQLNGWASDVIRLQAEIIELQTKPSKPIGRKAYMNAFGKPSTFSDKGLRKRAILAIGKQDVDIHGLVAMDLGITIEGASSDHLIVDVTDSVLKLQVGDTIDFQVTTYASVLSGMASNYIEQRIYHEVL